MKLPHLVSEDPLAPASAGGITLAVFAPLGTDKVLSRYPDGIAAPVAEHPLVQHLRRVADCGIGVVALIDLVDAETCLVEIPAHGGRDMRITPRGKQDMQSPRTLTFLLTQAHQCHPERAIVLALEGHGAGFLPDLDTTQITSRNATAAGLVQWRIGHELSAPLNPDGSAYVEQGAPILPFVCPTSPTNHLALSTYALGAALKAAIDAGVPRLACIHFNNCFNMAVEVMHTVAPYAEYATGYENYNFFTAGEAYPDMFAKLAGAGSASTQQLARWFADGNHEVLARKGHHPTVGCVVPLARMHAIVGCIDDLSDALLAALRSTRGAQRAAYANRIEAAIRRAQQFDQDGNFLLETPDQLTDIRSLAHELQQEDFGPFQVEQAAAALGEVLGSIKHYGDTGRPWLAPTRTWDFASKELAMSIFLPDPLRIGRWDWRSPYYLDVNPDPAKPQVQRNVIEFVKVTDWVDFLVEYHKEVRFEGLLPAVLPDFPHFRQDYQPPRSEPCDPRPCAKQEGAAGA